MLLDLKELIKEYNLNIKGILHIGANADNENEYELYKNIGVENTLFFEPLPHVFDTYSLKIK